MDQILKKIKVLEGIVQENVLLYDKSKWIEAYKKYRFFSWPQTSTDEFGMQRLDIETN